MWIRYNMMALWRLLVGLSAFCSAAIFSSGETFFHAINRRAEYTAGCDALRWYLKACPKLGLGHNFIYETICCNADSSSTYTYRSLTPTPLSFLSASFPDIWADDDPYSIGPNPFYSVFAEASSISSWDYPTLWPCVPYCPGDAVVDPGYLERCDSWQRGPLPRGGRDNIYLQLDPQFPLGSVVPFYASAWSYLDCYRQGSSSYWDDCPGHYTRLNDTFCLSRAYVLPQRIAITNGYSAEELWDMYGDGRMFFPRYIYQGGYASDFNVMPFDAEMWEQLHFYGSSVNQQTFQSTTFDSRLHDFAPNEILPSSFQFQKALVWDGSQLGTFSSSINWQGISYSYTLKNQRWFSTNIIDPSQFPYLCDLFGAPGLKTNNFSGNSWKSWKYLPQSVQKGDFGKYSEFPGITPARELPGFLGILVYPVSSSTGAYAAFRYFRFLPGSHPSSGGDNLGFLMLWRPSGLAYDKNGGLVFDWVKSGKPLQTVFKWPYLASWDFDCSFIVRADGAATYKKTTPPGPNDIKLGPESTPLPENPPVDGVPPLPTPGGGGGGGSSSPFPIPWLGGSTPVLGGGSGSSLLGQGPDSWVLNDGGNPISYSQDTPASLPTDDNGDLQGEYNISYPGLSDIYDFSYFANQNLWATEYEDNLIASAIFVTNPVTDFGLAGSPPPVGSFGNAVASADGSGSLQSFGHWDTSKSWFYSVVPLNPVIPKSQVLVLPWFVNEDGEIDFDSTKEFSLEGLDGSRNLILLIVGIGMSCYFVLAIIRLFQGGN